MKQRIITGVLGAVLFLVFLYVGNWWYSSAIALLAVIGFYEFAKMKQLSGRKPQVWIGMGMVLLLLISELAEQSLVPHYPFLRESVIVTVTLVIYLLWMVISRNRVDIFEISYLFLGALYIGKGFSALMETIWQPHGLALSLLVLFTTWANDSGAYFIGRKWGRHKPWPEISPNKTIEGSVAGVVSGILVSVAVFFCVPALGDVWKALWAGLLITVVGQIGDLIESAWKRTTGIKDSGSILPGHGGVLDRFDSLLFTFIILHLFHIV